MQWLRIVMQAAATVLHCLVYKRNRSGDDLLRKATAMLRIESSALERHCRAEIHNAWAWKCIVLKSSGMA